MVERPILVCGPTSNFADDVHTQCAECAAPIVHRPHVPPDALTLCGPCAVRALAGQDFEIAVTEDTRREVALFLAKTKGTQ